MIGFANAVTGLFQAVATTCRMPELHAGILLLEEQWLFA